MAYSKKRTECPPPYEHIYGNGSAAADVPKQQGNASTGISKAIRGKIPWYDIFSDGTAARLEEALAQVKRLEDEKHELEMGREKQKLHIQRLHEKSESQKRVHQLEIENQQLRHDREMDRLENEQIRNLTKIYLKINKY